jgi:RNA-directed DNA polymerase
MQRAANVTSGDLLDWHTIEWKHVYRTVKNLRQRIFRASRDGDLKKVRSLQRLMLRSRANIFEMCSSRHPGEPWQGYTGC